MIRIVPFLVPPLLTQSSLTLMAQIGPAVWAEDLYLSIWQGINNLNESFTLKINTFICYKNPTF